MVELLKKNIRMNRQKSSAVSQVALEEDVNVPDSKPDVRSIIQEDGTISVEDTRIEENRVVLTGYLKVGVLYIADGEELQIHKLESRLPFEEKLNLEGARDGDNVRVRWDVEDLKVSLINSRKVSMQALVTFHASIEELYDVQAGVELHGIEGLSVQTQELKPLSLAVQKKDILRVKDEIVLSSNKPNIGELLWDSIQLRGTDVRVMDGQLDIKGELFVFILYAGDDENATKQWIETTIPFHETIACAGCSPSMVSDVELSLAETSLEVRPDYDGEERLVQVEAVLELDIKLYEEETVEVLADVYTPLKELVPITSTQAYESLVVKNFSKCRVGDRIRMEAKQPRMLQVCHSRGEVKVDEASITENGIQAEGAVYVSVLYITAEDQQPFAMMHGAIPFTHTISVPKINQDCRYRLQTELEQLSTTMIDSEEMEVKAGINLNVLVVQVHEQNCILDVEERELDLKKLQELPGIVGYVVQPQDSLWSIAKSHYTTPEQIMELNDLSSKELQPGTSLLLMKSMDKMH